MESLTIRPEAPSDIPIIHRIVEAAFANAPRTSHTEHYIVSALRRAGALSVSLVAEHGGSLVGHVALSPVTTTAEDEHWYGLGPISVLPERQGKGIGAELLRAALTQLQAIGAAGCVVLGEPSYYSRFGFCPEPGLVLKGVSPKHFLAISFTPKIASGEVSYHESFGAAG